MHPSAEQYGERGPFDCDDRARSVHPGADEVCDGLDNDCDGTLDDGSDRSVFYADGDGDGYGSPLVTAELCEQTDGWVDNNQDCADNDPYSHPGVLETCDGFDENCNGDIDENPTNPRTWYVDEDGDGYGTTAESVVSCTQPSGNNYVLNAEDCDDTNSSIAPNVPEICDGVDQNCNEEVDEDAVDQLLLYVDIDTDGFGGVTSAFSCWPIDGWVENSLDCDDDDPQVHPNATEVCNEQDDDCDGTIDMYAEDALPWFADADGDDWGIGAPIYECVQPAGFTHQTGDCAPENAQINPDENELCDDGVDNNCQPYDCGFPYYQTSADIVGTFSGVQMGGTTDMTIVEDNGEMNLFATDTNGELRWYQGGFDILGNATIFGAGLPIDYFATTVATLHQYNDDDLLAVGYEDSNGTGTVLIFEGPFSYPLDPVDAIATISLGTYGVTRLIPVDLDQDGTDELWTVDDYYLREFLPDFSGSLTTANDHSTIAGGDHIAAVDLNLDGHLDLVWSDKDYSSGAGRVQFKFNPVFGISAYTVDGTWTGEGPSGQLGSFIGACDLNNDLKPELFVGARAWGSSRGKVYMLDGASSHSTSAEIASVANGSIHGEFSDDLVNEALCANVVSSPYPELLLPVPYADTSNAGAVVFFTGASGLSTFSGQTGSPFALGITGSTANQYFGAIVIAHDLDGDFDLDLLVANGGTTNGKIWILHQELE